MSYKRVKNGDKITSDSIAMDNLGTTLNDFFNSTKGSMTITNNNVNYYLNWIKNGKVVTLTIVSSSNALTQNTNIVLTTLPEGLRPAYESIFGIFGYGVLIGTGWVQSNGNVYYRKTSSSTDITRVLITYVVE